MTTEHQIKEEYNLIKSTLNEKQRRLMLWAKAKTLWYWWRKIVSLATWVSMNTIKKGKDELEKKDPIVAADRIRNIGWWRKKMIDKYPEIGVQIEKELDGNTIWDPMSLLTRTTKSLSNLSHAIFTALWINAWRDLICRFLKEKGYSLQLNKKMIEWWDHEDRNEQFEFIKTKSEEFINEWCPVISVDTKKKELVWNFKNAWETWHKEWEAPIVNVYDFPSLAKWKAVPYWIYDVAYNKWWVSVWVSADTGEFSVESIRSWMKNIGQMRYPEMKKIYINCDWWWSNWSRCRLWKRELQKLANEYNIEIHVSHFPPWTSKRNKIEHRLFCHISNNRKWIPLESFATIINLIGNTTTSKWLTVQCALDERIYEKWIKISNKELASLSIEKNGFHWEWNYIISSQKD
jgi:hypothetical protein